MLLRAPVGQEACEGKEASSTSGWPSRHSSRRLGSAVSAARRQPPLTPRQSARSSSLQLRHPWPFLIRSANCEPASARQALQAKPPRGAPELCAHHRRGASRGRQERSCRREHCGRPRRSRLGAAASRAASSASSSRYAPARRRLRSPASAPGCDSAAGAGPPKPRPQKPSSRRSSLVHAGSHRASTQPGHSHTLLQAAPSLEPSMPHWGASRNLNITQEQREGF
jgi:hypothetical protein